MPLKRITITIPEDLVAQADRKGAELDRSRSWVLVDALRGYLEPPALSSADGSRSAGQGSLAPGVHESPVSEVHEPRVDYAAGLGASRLIQLEADLRLSPEERVLAAERTLLIDDQRRSPHDGVLSFDRYDDYVEWKRRQAARR